MMERQMETNTERREASVAKLQREIRNDTIKIVVAILALVAAAFAAGYYI